MKLHVQFIAIGLAFALCWCDSTLVAQQPAQQPLWTSIPARGSIGYQTSELALVGYVSPIGSCAGGGEAGGACAGAGCYSDGCGSRCDHSGAWVSIDYLLWQVSGYHVQPLVTSSPPGTARPDSGLLPDATILYGDERLENDLRSGGRLRFGYWYDDWRTYGFEGSFVALGTESSNFFAPSDGSTGSLNRPFFNDDPSVNDQDSLLIGFDDPIVGDAYTGSTRVTTSSNLYSGHFAYRRNIRQGGGHRLDWTAGYRFFRLDEGLQINDDITVDGIAGGIIGTNFRIQDQFNTSNAFHGAEVGLVSMTQSGRWTTELIAKLALGNNHREVTINGSTTTTISPAAPIETQGGLLTQSSNIGSYRNDHFVVIPEVNANFGYQVSENWKLTAGYSVIFVSDVVRPGDQIDYNVNGTLLAGPFAGPATPAFNFESDSLWVHGLNLGAQFNY